MGGEFGRGGDIGVWTDGEFSICEKDGGGGL